MASGRVNGKGGMGMAADDGLGRSRVAAARERFRRGLDLPALVVGALVGAATLLAIALVGARLDVSADDPDTSGPLVGFLLLLAVVGLGASGAVAARRCRRAPLVHGAGAAIVAVLTVEIAAVLRQLVTGDPIAWWPGAAWLLLALACGTAGGLAVLRAPRARRRADSPV
jgi:hypothetical protein